MNNERRKVINKMIAKLEEVQSELDSCADLEQEEYDNMPEGLQESERGHRMQENIDILYGMYESIDDLTDQLNYITGKLTTLFN